LPILDRFRRVRPERPFNTSNQHLETWQTRAVDAVSLWVEQCGNWRPDGGRPLRIADLGAGSEQLRDVLAARLEVPYAYLAYDLHPQRPTTVPLNVLEELPDEVFDLAFCLGVLEYLPPDNAFISRLRSRCRFAVVSFVYMGSAFPAGASERAALGWRSHFDRPAFEQEFGNRGFARVDFRTTNDDQTGLWLWAAPDS
jgi:hypothetical protein